MQIYLLSSVPISACPYQETVYTEHICFCSLSRAGGHELLVEQQKHLHYFPFMLYLFLCEVPYWKNPVKNNYLELAEGGRNKESVGIFGSI